MAVKEGMAGKLAHPHFTKHASLGDANDIIDYNMRDCTILLQLVKRNSMVKSILKAGAACCSTSMTDVAHWDDGAVGHRRAPWHAGRVGP